MVEIQRWLHGSATDILKGLAIGADSALLAGLAFAALFGFMHAFMQGHGKVALVSYYLGHSARILGSVFTGR
jgi:ABC-type nickel/cobalt efflux system permease component RcnA